ncbi:MAG: riboflavin kinase [Patescibacteria group bacterium]|jgi:riboflavin kinase/FMN adenylyltransferase
MLTSVTGKVVKRSGRGKQLGFPTVNLEVPTTFTLAFGSYAGYVQVQNQRYLAAIYYGTTSWPSSKPQLEAHLLDFSGDLFNQAVTVECVQFIRPHKKIKHLKELIDCIKQDIKQVRTCLPVLLKP